MKNAGLALLITAAFWVLYSDSVQAGNASRLIPFGKVTIIEEGKETTRYQSEVPFPEGTLMLCSGSCVVQGRGLQLSVRDKTLFAATETADGWDVTVYAGRVEFGLGAIPNPVNFHTPRDVIAIRRDGAQDGGTRVVRGSTEVNNEGTRFTVTRGVLNVAAGSGEQTLKAGESLFLTESALEPTAAVIGAKGTGVVGGTAKPGGTEIAGASNAVPASKETGTTTGGGATGVSMKVISGGLMAVAAGTGTVVGATTFPARKNGMVSSY